MAIFPDFSSFSCYRGSTLDFTITLVSGNSTVPMNLTGCSSTMIIGPYVSLSSLSPTISGSISINPEAGQIQITVSGSTTSTIYSPQPYYIGLQTPNNSEYYLLNGTINFVSPFSRAIVPQQQPLVLGSLSFTIDVDNFQDLTPVPQPQPPPNISGAIYGNIFNS